MLPTDRPDLEVRHRERMAVNAAVGSDNAFEATKDIRTGAASLMSDYGALGSSFKPNWISR